jgi:hypothetical protein
MKRMMLMRAKPKAEAPATAVKTPKKSAKVGFLRSEDARDISKEMKRTMAAPTAYSIQIHHSTSREVTGTAGL